MIINGGSRSNGGFFATHLMRADHNEAVHVVEIRGLGAETVPDAFREMKAIASGTRCKNYFYHADINTRADEVLTSQQWEQAADTLEGALHLTGQPRVIVEHEKEGRIHRHIVWSRIDADSMTAISDSLTYPKHEKAARALEQAFGHQAVPSVLVKDRETERPERTPKDWESFRAQESGIDPKAMKAELTELWLHSDSGPAFAAALAERGYILARGDRRDFCVVDPAADEHSLARRISGVKAAEIRLRMAEVDREALPSVEAARAMARQRRDEPTDSAPVERTPFDAILAEAVQEVYAARVQLEYVAEAPAPAAPEPTLGSFETIMAQTVQDAAREATRAAQAERVAPGSQFEQFRSWCSVVWSHLAEFGQAVREQFRAILRQAPEPETASPREQDREHER